MLGYIPQVYVMVTAVISQQVYGEECDDGWFGENCRYRCHCDQSRSCDQSSGECPTNDTCDSSYFGPGCQFVDRLFYQTESFIPSFLRDSDDDTCNPDPNATSIEFVQNRPVPLSFIRIVVNDNKNLLNFTLTLNDVVPCSTLRKFKISDTVVDVTCDVTVQLDKLRIDGPIVGSICSIHISGGRNVALRQNTSQTSTYPNRESSRAVDGDNYLCSATKDYTTPQEWMLTFSRPQIIYVVHVVNNFTYFERLRGFRLETFDQNGSLVFFHKDQTRNLKAVYHVIVDKHTPVMTLKISFTNKNHSLSLCEVLIYGDDVCQKSYTYGLYCQHPCQCGRVDVCNVVTGACAPGCPIGFYGFNCSTPCSVNCLEGLCEWRTGYCFPCISGYSGDTCNTECYPGTYGENCTYNCSERCADTCNHIHGACHCKREFTGPECKFCASTFYGELCEHNCSSRCRDRLCEPYTGMCFACVEGYQGSYCEFECDPGTYGENCTYNCSERCADTCNHIHGACHCKREFIGPECKYCASTFYGELCEHNCSSRCRDRLCERYTGMCFACVEGYQGSHCEFGAIIIWLMLIPLAVLIVCLCFFAAIEEREEPEE